MKRLVKILLYTLLFIFLLLCVFYAYVKWGLQPDIPQVKDQSVLELQRQTGKDSMWFVGDNWLKRNDSGLWEEYVEGSPFNRGVVLGKLNKELMYDQELAFVNQIHELVPSDTYLGFLGMFTRVFNRHLDQNVDIEYREEIYGESLSAPHDFDYISPAYDRMLNYHAAHDIGHAMQSLALVGCTSFAAWDEYSSDSSLIIGRNFDFYVGDDFAKNKIVLFVHPDAGHKFAMLTWPGMIGAVSGMNDAGLTITLNAAKSDMPTSSATPISILGREILQYASTIDEAYAIAKKRKTFVSETLMIGSAKDHKTALIEKSPTKTALFFSDKHYLLCANHYQSDTFKNEQNNINNIRESASMYRFQHLTELVGQTKQLNYSNAATLLRDQRGKGGSDIGFGNEKAMNQLIAHHGIIFQPEKLKFWVSTSPYQLGKFICYDLNTIFANPKALKQNHVVYDTTFTIVADTFLGTQQWKDFLRYRELKNEIKKAIKQKAFTSFNNTTLAEIVQRNPNYWEAYYWVAEYLQAKGDKKGAQHYFELALTKEVNAQSEVEKIKRLIEACKK